MTAKKSGRRRSAAAAKPGTAVGRPRSAGKEIDRARGAFTAAEAERRSRGQSIGSLLRPSLLELRGAERDEMERQVRHAAERGGFEVLVGRARDRILERIRSQRIDDRGTASVGDRVVLFTSSAIRPGSPTEGYMDALRDALDVLLAAGEVIEDATRARECMVTAHLLMEKAAIAAKAAALIPSRAQGGSRAAKVRRSRPTFPPEVRRLALRIARDLSYRPRKRGALKKVIHLLRSQMRAAEPGTRVPDASTVSLWLSQSSLER